MEIGSGFIPQQPTGEHDTAEVVDRIHALELADGKHGEPSAKRQQLIGLYGIDGYMLSVAEPETMPEQMLVKSGVSIFDVRATARGLARATELRQD